MSRYITALLLLCISFLTHAEHDTQLRHIISQLNTHQYDAAFLLANDLADKGTSNTGILKLVSIASLYGQYQQPLNIERGIAMMKRAAELGDIEAMSNMGVILGDNNFLKQDCQQAMIWLNKAAQAGHDNAALTLVDNYNNGECAPVDHAQALSYLAPLLDKNHAGAQSTMAIMHSHGMGVTQDHNKAFAFFHAAAEQNNCTGIYNIGTIYGNGIGRAQDTKKAFEYFTKGDQLGCIDASVALGHFYLSGIDRAVDKNKAREIYQKAVDQGNTEAMTLIVSTYDENNPEEQKIIMSLLQQAAERGNERAILTLATHHFNDNNFDTAFEYASKSAELKDSAAYSLVAWFYEMGKVVSQDYQLAAQWYEKGVNLGEPEARIRLAQWYTYGIHFPRDHLKAKALLESSLSREDSSVKAHLAILQSCSDNTEVRAPEKALTMMLDYIEGKNSYYFINDLGLAATYAGVGNFVKAEAYINEMLNVLKAPDNAFINIQQPELLPLTLSIQQAIKNQSACYF